MTRTDPAIAEDIRSERGLRIRAPRATRDLTAEAVAWVAENQPVYRLLRRWAFEDQMRYGRWAIDRLFSNARFLCQAPKRKGRYFCDNSLRAPVARLLCQDNPWLVGGIEFRRSRTDLTIGRPIGERNVAGCAGENPRK